MTLDTFFEKFDLFADAPDAVAKMRELVLELAVRGWLLEDGQSDHLGAFNPKDQITTPFPIPAHWRWSSLGEAADCRASAKVSPSSIADNAWVLDLEDIEGTTGQVIQFATFAERRSLSTKAAFEPGDVLYGKLRPYLNKVVIATKPGYCTTEIIPLRPVSFLVPEFLRLYLRSQTFLRYAAQKNYGMKMPRLGTKDLEAADIPLPPLAEQKRIVAKVDELMALCDRLEAQQQEREAKASQLARASLARFADAPTPANLDYLFHSSFSIPPSDLRKSILTLAVQGKLVPQDPNDEPAEELLARISASLPNKKSENPFLGEIEASITEESEYELPYGWSWLPLGHVGIWATGCGFPTQYQGEADKEYLFCKVSDMNLPGNEVEIHSTVHTIDAEVMKKIRARANPAGTVIFPKIGGAIATHKRRLVIKPTIIDNNCSGIQPIGLTDDRWLLLFMRNLDLTKYQSGTSVPAVSQGSLDPIRIGIPPLAEQRRIVAKVEQLMALVDALETQLAASRTTAANLLSALVAELTVKGAECHE